MTRPWRVGIMGLGHWYSGVSIAQAAPFYPRIQLAGVASSEADKANAFGELFGIPAYSDYDQFLAEADADVLHISPASSEMRDCVVKAAQAGKHMVVGKPIAMNLAEVDEMIEAVEAAGVVCMPYQGLRRLNDSLKRELDSGVIGEVKIFHITQRVGIAEDWIDSGTAGWFADPKQCPGGSFADEGTYALEQLTFLTGSRVVEISGAKVANLVHPGLEVEDWAMGTFTFENGVIATIESAWTISIPRLSGPSPKDNNVGRTEIVGTKGEMLSDRMFTPGDGLLSSAARYWTFTRPRPPRTSFPRPRGVDYVIDCVEQNQAPVASLRDARENLRVVLAFYEAARSGKTVTL